MAWDRHTNVAVLNRLLRSLLSTLGTEDLLIIITVDMAWDRHTNVAVLNRLMRSLLSLLLVLKTY